MRYREYNGYSFEFYKDGEKDLIQEKPVEAQSQYGHPISFGAKSSEQNTDLDSFCNQLIASMLDVKVTAKTDKAALDSFKGSFGPRGFNLQWDGENYTRAVIRKM
jgi:hypothetical protein